MLNSKIKHSTQNTVINIHLGCIVNLVLPFAVVLLQYVPYRNLFRRGYRPKLTLTHHQTTAGWVWVSWAAVLCLARSELKLTEGTGGRGPDFGSAWDHDSPLTSATAIKRIMGTVF